MVVADCDLERIRERIDQNTDVKPIGASLAGEILAILEFDSTVKASLLAGCAERAVEALALPLDRSPSDYADAAIRNGGDPADVVILGLNSAQHARCVLFAEACQAYASNCRAANAMRDLGDAQTYDALKSPVSAASEAQFPLLRASAAALLASIPEPGQPA